MQFARREVQGCKVEIRAAQGILDRWAFGLEKPEGHISANQLLTARVIGEHVQLTDGRITGRQHAPLEPPRRVAPYERRTLHAGAKRFELLESVSGLHLLDTDRLPR